MNDTFNYWLPFDLHNHKNVRLFGWGYSSPVQCQRTIIHYQHKPEQRKKCRTNGIHHLSALREPSQVNQYRCWREWVTKDIAVWHLSPAGCLHSFLNSKWFSFERNRNMLKCNYKSFSVEAMNCCCMFNSWSDLLTCHMIIL